MEHLPVFPFSVFLIYHDSLLLFEMIMFLPCFCLELLSEAFSDKLSTNKIVNIWDTEI